MKSLPTIKLRGVSYVQVKDRVLHFHEIYPNGSITTQVIHNENGTVTFKAMCIPDTNTPQRCFTGHSFGTIDEVKAFEKLESVAVGRCLALLGIGIIDSIASADEMEIFHEKKEKLPWPVYGYTSDKEPLVSGKYNGREWFAKVVDGERVYFKTRDEWIKSVDTTGVKLEDLKF